MSRRGHKHPDEKLRDMARSILPCRNRHTARSDKARTSRRSRRVEREALDRGAEDELATRQRQRRIEMSAVVWQRRGGDKVNHFCRWGRARTAHLPPKERVAALRGVLGAGSLITEHALLHFEHAAARDPREGRRERALAWRAERARGSAKGRPFASERALRKLLRRAFAQDHAGLNRVLKALALEPCAPDAPCRRPASTRTCGAALVIRVPDDLHCVARRLWRSGREGQPVGPSGDARLATYLVEEGLWRPAPIDA